MISLNEFSYQLSAIVAASKNNLHFTLGVVALLWVIQLVNMIVGNRLLYLGILPRHPIGLLGIFFSPFLHGNMEHLFFNSIPLFLLMNLALIDGYQLFYITTLMIIIIGGGLVWLFGRKSIHVGASTLIMGYWSYLLVNAIYNPSIMTLILAGLCIYYLGGLFVNLFVFEKGVSWEGHLFGFIAGIATVYLQPHLLQLYN